MANEEQTVIFFVTHNGLERSFELPEYDVVGDLKLHIFEIFDIPPDKQIINGWKNIPNTDKTILQYCGDVCSVTYLTVQCSEKNEDITKCENKEMEMEKNMVLDDDIEAAISGYQKIKKYITSDVTINVVPLAEAIAKCCFTGIQERKVLFLYLHSEKDDFSRRFLKNLNTKNVSDILKNNFFVLAWDVENTQYHADMERALEEFELSRLASTVRCKMCCVLLIQNINGCIAVNSRLTGNMSDKDFLSALENTSSFLVNEKQQETELQNLERNAGNVNDITSSKYQKLMADMLGDRDYDCFEFSQHQELKDKIAYALYGPPEKQEGYDRKQMSKVETVYVSIIESSNGISEFKDRIEISFIYNCTEPLPSEKIARAKKYSNGYNPNTDLSPVPIFVLRKCHESDHPCRIFIDDIGRVYASWEQYINKNKLHKCKMVLPRDGRYEINGNNGGVMLESHLSPACGLDIKILQGADMVSTGAGLVSGGIFLAAMIPAVTVAPAILVTAGVVGAGTGLYALGRSIYTLVDRSKHKETLSFANSEARGAYLNIVAGSLGFVGAGATMAVSQFAARGVNIGQGAGALINTLGVANIGASGASLINSTYDVMDQWINENQRPTLLTMVQLSSSILFFGNAVYNFRTCSTIVEETQARALQDYQESLRSNRHRKTFNKLMKETIRQNDGNSARGRAEVISAIRKLPNKDEVFAALTRSNKEMNRNGVKFFASGGEITLNGQPIDLNKFTTMNKSATSAFLSKLPVKSDISHSEVTSMEGVFSRADFTMPDLEVVARYAVHLLGSFQGSIQALIVTALQDLLGYLAAAFQATLDEMFPNASKYYNLLQMIVEFFGGVALKLGSKDEARGNDQCKRLFETAVRACFCGGHLSEMAMKELMVFFSNWLADKILNFQNERDAARRSREHSGTDGGTMLGAIAGLGAILLVFLLYVKNKGWWWSPVRGMACCDDVACPPVSARPLPSSVPASVPHSTPKVKLAKPYSGGGGDSSSESEHGATCRPPGGAPLPAEAPAGACHAAPRRCPDLASLVEKGRVGVSSNSSCCSSTTSSVGERQGVAPVNGTVPRTPRDLRETKIDNHTIDYQPEHTSTRIERIDNNCNRDCIVVMHPEADDRSSEPALPCVDGELASPSSPSGGRCGHLEIALLYDAPMRKMSVHVLQARDLPSRDRGQPTHTQVRLILLPSKKQKHKTKIRSGENPQYMESFVLHRVNPEDVNSMGVRLRVYGCERMRRERLIGEAVVSFANINLELENNFWLTLEPRSNTTLTGDLLSLARSDSTSSAHSMQHGGVPELLLGLCYNAITGRLSVEVVKGSHFSYLLRNFGMNRAPDTYVKLNLVSSTGQELAQNKTSVRRGQPNPLFKETFVFQVALFQLADVTLMIAVYNRKGVTKKKEMVGWFSLGLNSSGAEELAHWMDMKEYQQEQISRWHILVQS